MGIEPRPCSPAKLMRLVSAFFSEAPGILFGTAFRLLERLYYCYRENLHIVMLAVDTAAMLAICRFFRATANFQRCLNVGAVNEFTDHSQASGN
jgi:hypothetical protein